MGLLNWLFGEREAYVHDSELTQDFLTWERLKIKQREGIRSMGNRHIAETRLQLMSRYLQVNRGEGKSPILGDDKQCSKARGILVANGIIPS